jgi:hypothetical protein
VVVVVVAGKLSVVPSVDVDADEVAVVVVVVVVVVGAVEEDEDTLDDEECVVSYPG